MSIIEDTTSWLFKVLPSLNVLIISFVEIVGQDLFRPSAVPAQFIFDIFSGMRKTQSKEDIPKIIAIFKDGLNEKPPPTYEEILKNVLKHHPESKMKNPAARPQGILT